MVFTNFLFSINSLKSIWDGYQTKIKENVEKLLSMGDFLFAKKVDI